MLTWTLKGALGQRFAIASSFMHVSEVGNVHIGGLVDGLQTNNVSKKPALRFPEALSVPICGRQRITKDGIPGEEVQEIV
jgi:hypothetical protein